MPGILSSIASQFNPKKKKKIGSADAGPSAARPGEDAFEEEEQAPIEDGTEDFEAAPHRRDRVGRRRNFNRPGRRPVSADRGRGIMDQFRSAVR